MPGRRAQLSNMRMSGRMEGWSTRLQKMTRSRPAAASDQNQSHVVTLFDRFQHLAARQNAHFTVSSSQDALP
jgi:hypothetical protein